MSELENHGIPTADDAAATPSDMTVAMPLEDQLEAASPAGDDALPVAPQTPTVPGVPSTGESDVPNRANLNATLPKIGEGDFSGLMRNPDETIGPDSGIDPSVFAGTEPFDLTEEPVEEPKRKRRRWPTLLLALIVLVGGAYLAGVVAFMQLFMPNTTLNGKDVSLKTIDTVAQANADSVDEFSFAVSGDGVDLTLGASDIQARYDGGAFARTAIAQQHPWRWPLEVLEPRSYDVETTLSYDAIRFEDVVGSAIDAVNKEAKPAEDAKIDFDDKEGLYKVTPEVLGTTIDKPAAIKQAREALDAGEATVELGDDLLLKPEVLSDDERLTGAVEKVNASLTATQRLVTHDKEVATVGKDKLREWVKLEDDLSVSFDEDACTKWAQKDLSDELDTIGNRRTFKLPDGREVTVEGGVYGWCCDGAAIASDIAENVRAGVSGDIQVTWKTEAETFDPHGQEWGSRFIEIDLGNQHVKMFDGDKVIWESDCVSGKTSDGHGTPSGVYYINSNMQSGNVELRGEIDPKTNEPEYISYVKYWMPFINNGYALHDADWRSSFGGDIYVNNGSHGCVNLPPDKAKELYGLVSVGTVVVVH